MPLLKELSGDTLASRLDEGLPLVVGPYVYRIRTNLPTIVEGLQTLYADFSIAPEDRFVDFDVALASSGPLQRLRGRAEFLFDGRSPFDSLAADQGYAFLEWGMNWCVSLHMNEYLKLHAAVVARDNTGIIMPGVPGAGKSTLCAALGLSGWRVLSDEHALLPLSSNLLVPLCRPVSLKNESIDVIRRFSDDAVLGPLSKETHKGVVCHLKADLAPDSHDTTPVPAGAMVFPRYSHEETQRLAPRRRTESFIIAAFHSFNYSLFGRAGFDAMRQLVDRVPCFDLVYHDLDWAVQAVNELDL